MDTSGGGSVRVELLDGNGKPLEGYAGQDSQPLCGNSTAMQVQAGEDLTRLVGCVIKLRFIMRDCKLYAFQFTS